MRGSEKEEAYRIIEAALFVAGGALPIARLAKLVGLSKKETAQLIRELNETSLASHPFYIRQVDEKHYDLALRREYEDRVRHLAPDQDFTKAVLQTLALIAYKNPIKQSVVVKIRSNKAYEHLDELEKRGFIKRKKSGHTKLVFLTRKFHDYFGRDAEEQLRKHFANNPAIDAILEEEEKAQEQPPEGESPTEPESVEPENESN